MTTRFSRAVLSGLAIVAIGAAAAPVSAQDNDETRIRKLEAEVRALQRSVFPGGAGKYFEPEITGATARPATSVTPSSTAVTDILARMDALEMQMQSLTAQTEENTNSVRLLTTRLAALEVTTGAAASEAASRPPAEMLVGAATQPATRPAANTTAANTSAANRPATTTPAATTPAATTPAASGPTAARLAAVQQIAKPQTDDAADDEYSYGFRLWEAGFYPEAQQQLTLFVEKYPTHSRISYGRNLLGRAYLDDGKAKEAAPWFLRNYQSDKQSARAPDSLLYLAEAMIASKDTSRACIALAEFGETYPALASGRLASQYQANLRKVKCN
ncbi:hypothetical protein GRI44_00815 [Altererythrobacter confluentis]|uniref:TolA-binding protein n=1 Tax=Allopontixanthobacter confluentis TaxID=1849021 RepID=A0A6L7GCF5_9SPHN|nr:hypothetical protein [Allopontixanthobacter confluentis]MXP13300.1 hypothetical protein [Allopontixanthobacter confluentis]